jgi:uncharacterized protein involved in response to NO
VFELLVTAKVVPSSLILFTLTMGAMISSEMSVLTKATLRHISEDGIPQIQAFLTILSKYFVGIIQNSA